LLLGSLQREVDQFYEPFAILHLSSQRLFGVYFGPSKFVPMLDRDFHHCDSDDRLSCLRIVFVLNYMVIAIVNYKHQLQLCFTYISQRRSTPQTSLRDLIVFLELIHLRSQMYLLFVEDIGVMTLSQIRLF